MNDTFLVRGRQAMRDLNSVLDRLARGQHASAQPIPQSVAFEQLRHDEGRAFVLPQIEDRQDVRMVQRDRGARFLLEAMKPFRIGGKRGRKNLESDVAAEPRISRAIDLPIPPAPIGARMS